MRIGQYLISRGLISEAQLDEALRAQSLFGGRIGTNLVELGHITLDQIGEALSGMYGLPIAPQAWMENPEGGAQTALPIEAVMALEILPLKLERRTLHVVLPEPTNLKKLDELAFATGLIMKPYVAAEQYVYYWLERRYGFQRDLRYIRLDQRGAGVRAPEEMIIERNERDSVRSNVGGTPNNLAAPPPADAEHLLHDLAMLDLGTAQELPPEMDLLELEVAPPASAASPAPPAPVARAPLPTIPVAPLPVLDKTMVVQPQSLAPPTEARRPAAPAPSAPTPARTPPAPPPTAPKPATRAAAPRVHRAHMEPVTGSHKVNPQLIDLAEDPAKRAELLGELGLAPLGANEELTHSGLHDVGEPEAEPFAPPPPAPSATAPTRAPIAAPAPVPIAPKPKQPSASASASAPPTPDNFTRPEEVAALRHALSVTKHRDTVVLATLGLARIYVHTAAFLAVGGNVVTGVLAENGATGALPISTFRIPVEADSLFKLAITLGTPWCGRPPATQPNAEIVAALQANAATEFGVFPLALGGRVLALLAVHASGGPLSPAIRDALEGIATEATAALARVIQAQKASAASAPPQP